MSSLSRCKIICYLDITRQRDSVSTKRPTLDVGLFDVSLIELWIKENCNMHRWGHLRNGVTSVPICSLNESWGDHTKKAGNYGSSQEFSLQFSAGITGVKFTFVSNTRLARFIWSGIIIRQSLMADGTDPITFTTGGQHFECIWLYNPQCHDCMDWGRYPAAKPSLLLV